jgi:hypothetical protein
MKPFYEKCKEKVHCPSTEGAKVLQGTATDMNGKLIREKCILGQKNEMTVVLILCLSPPKKKEKRKANG